MQYRIVLRGEVDVRLFDRPGPLEVHGHGRHTELIGEITDQSHLLGLLSQINGAGIELISATPHGYEATSSL